MYSMLRISLLYHGLDIPKEKLIEEFEKNYRYKIDEKLKLLLLKKQIPNENEVKLLLNNFYNFIVNLWTIEPSERKQSNQYQMMIELNHKLREV